MIGILAEADASVIRRVQKKATLFHESKESRAPPLAPALDSPSLTPKTKEIATFCLRRSSLLSVTRCSFPLHPPPPTASKTSADTLDRFLPTRFALPAIHLFPITEDYIDTPMKMAGVVSDGEFPFAVVFIMSAPHVPQTPPAFRCTPPRTNWGTIR